MDFRPWSYPKCILCLEILANNSMKPPQLARHLKTKHSEHEEKFLKFFPWFKLMQYSNQDFTRLNNCLAVRGFLLKSKRKKPTYHWGNT